MAADEGVARNAVIWFKGVPILATPYLSFPLSDARKSGLLPPSFYFDSKSGFELSLPVLLEHRPRSGRHHRTAAVHAPWPGPGLWSTATWPPDDKGVLNLFGLPKRPRGRPLTRHGRLHPPGQPAHGQFALSDPSTTSSCCACPTTITGATSRTTCRTRRRACTTATCGSSGCSMSATGALGDGQTSLYAGVQSWQTLKDLDPKSDPTAERHRAPPTAARRRSASAAAVAWTRP